ncbi:hypothetical protein [Lacinutrix chionoecetis]
MKHSKQEIAVLFSKGEFNKVMDNLSENIIWNIVGDQVLEGKKTVLENCQQTAAYFSSVETEFKTNDLMVSNNKIIITGTAEFKRNGKRLNFISACDVYEFDENDMIKAIASYCIPENN